MDSLISRVAALEAERKPADGWSKTDFTAEVSEAISSQQQASKLLEDVRKAAEKVTGFDAIYRKKDEEIRRLESVVQEMRRIDLGALEVMEWWDANQQPINDLRQNREVKRNIEELTLRAEAAVQEAGRKATQAKEEALREINRVTHGSSGLVTQITKITERAESAAANSAKQAADQVKQQLADASQQIAEMQRLKQQTQSIVNTAGEQYLNTVRQQLSDFETTKQQLTEQISQREQTYQQLLTQIRQESSSAATKAEQQAVQAAVAKLAERDGLLAQMRDIQQQTSNQIGQIEANTERQVQAVVDGAPATHNTLRKIAEDLEASKRKCLETSQAIVTKLDESLISNTPTVGKLPLYTSRRTLQTQNPQNGLDAVNKQTLDSVKAELSQTINQKAIPETQTTTALGNGAAGKFLKANAAGGLTVPAPVHPDDIATKRFTDATYITATRLQKNGTPTGNEIPVRDERGNIVLPVREPNDNPKAALSYDDAVKLIKNSSIDIDKIEGLTEYVGLRTSQESTKAVNTAKAETTSAKIKEKLLGSTADATNQINKTSQRHKVVVTDSYGKISLDDPENQTDAANKRYVDAKDSEVKQVADAAKLASQQAQITANEAKTTAHQAQQAANNPPSMIVVGNLTENDGKLHVEF